MKPLRVVFMGTPAFAVPSLEALHADEVCTVVAVVTAPDKPAGRGQQLQASAVKQRAEVLGIPVLQPANLKSDAFFESLQTLKPDLNVVVAFRMLPKVIWALPPMGSINLHGSLLPDYRGAAPIHWAVLNGETQTGLTTFFLKQEIDTGNIIDSVTLDIPNTSTTGELYTRMMHAGAALLVKTVRAVAFGTAQKVPQDATLFRHAAPKITKETAHLKHDKTVQQQYNFIRGLSPVPGAWALLHGKMLKFYFSEKQPKPHLNISAGRLVKHEGKLWLGCTDGALYITDIQLEGRKRLTGSVFAQGYPVLDEELG